MTEHTPRFHDITIENLTANGGKQAAVISGLPESPVKHVVLKNVHISGSEKGIDTQYAEITATDLVVTPTSGEAILKGPGVTVNGK